MIFRHPKAPLIIGVVVILGLAAYVALYRSSPGELSNAHVSVAGSSFITDCQKCHAQKDVSIGCLKCHSEIQGQLVSKQGFHSYLTQSHPTGCATCHSEHNGAEFKLVNNVSWKEIKLENFSHPHVSFRLGGKHASASCTKCHAEKLQKPFVLPKFPNRPRSQTYLGLTQECVACHADPHAGGRVTNCLPCHDQNTFRKTVGFNHDKYFSLKGGHERVSCLKCHSESKGSPFGSVRGKTCQECHKNPHRVNWKTRCESCHKQADASWALGVQRMTKAQHASTGFDLVKPHAAALCAQCHKSNTYLSTRRNVLECELCHQSPHGDQFSEKYPHCINCHGKTSYRPTTFGVAAHKTYLLTGGHESARCELCHRVNKTTKIRQFVGVSRRCEDCHKDVHVGQFRVNGVTACDSCHVSFNTWKKHTFNHNKNSTFVLDSAHKNVACALCHPAVTLSNGMTVTQYKPIRHRCEDCHTMEGR